ncbi:NUDIX domain-containing protein [Cryomorpha ignava]|uniref:NUDIX domain-containing protein n=1 Tax=Cryomorpha ignava TaxID=101383 RepID=A0A7K3WL99_9FLAO|nr:NUDIX domain-containing protein [Cryomorpha ignava]NEN22410.1 NUDIX domain-containing protein [Cryomorpha ignava]
MYKVFFNDKFVLLTDKYEYDVLGKGVLLLRYEDFEELHFVIALLNESKFVSAVVILSTDVEELWADFRSHFVEIDAAGGLVTNSRNELLLIHRNGLWDLPKGKLEESEHASDGALREVEEECGITDLQLVDKITTTYHVYSMKGFTYLKRTFWYSMISNQEEFVPQGDEGIDKVEWVKIEEFNWDNLETYASIKEVVNQFLVLGA